MDFGIGCDIEKISRFENKIDHKRFLEKIYTLQEIEYCLKKPYAAQHLAVRYCAKEAVVKAFYSLGISDVYYREIEIVNDKFGAPQVKILKDKHKNLTIKVSLSHTNDYAVASAHVINPSS